MVEHLPALPGSAPVVALLGEPVVKVGAAAPRALERHDAALLALLLLDGPQSRGALAHLLWPDAEPASALNSLRQRLHRLRREAGDLLDADPGTVRLAATVVHDLHPGQVAMAQGSEPELLGSLYFPPGEALTERVQALRERWLSLRFHAVEAAAEKAEQDQHLDTALRHAERLVLMRPLSEHAFRRCMRLHYLRGDRAQALVVYAQCRDRLRLQLGMAPDAETEQLARLLESGALTAQHNLWAAPRIALANPPRLVGRQSAWSLLESVCQEAVVVLLRGEAGIGKSRLAAEFARARGPALFVKAHAGERDSPFALADRLLQEMQAPLRTRPALAGALDVWAQRRHATLVIDDVQWADQASLELLLGWLDRSASRLPAVLLCVRNDELPADLARWLSARDPVALLDLRLGALDEAGIAELLTSLQLPSVPADALPAAAASLMRQTGGHPFVLLELLRCKPDAWSDPPEGRWEQPGAQRLIALLQQRIQRLPPDTQRLAAVCAIAGALFSRRLASEVTGLSGADLLQAWQQLVDAQLVLNEGVMFDLVAEAVAQGLPLAALAAWHRRVAATLAAHAERPDAIAQHWQAARCWPDAARCFEQAAQLAAASARRVEELVFWDRAAHCWQQGQDEAAAGAAQLAALTAAIVVESGQVLAHRIAAVEAVVSQPSERLRVLLAKSRALINAGDGAAALLPAQQALELAQTQGDAAGLVAAAGWKAVALALAQQVSEGLRLLAAHAEQATAVESLRARLDFFGSWGYVFFLSGAYEDALDAMGTAAGLAEDLGDLGEAMEQVCNLSTCLNALGRHEESVVQGERAVALWRRHGEPKSVSAAAIQTQLAAVYTGVGRFCEAIDLLAWALSCFRAMGPPNWQTTAEHRLATIYLRLGQPARARQCLTPLPAAADVGRAVARILVECRIAAALGQPLLERLRQAEKQFAARLAPMDRRSLLLLLAAHLPAAAARSLAEQLLSEAEQAGDAPAALHAQVRLADALRQLGDGAAAAAQARRAWSCGVGAAVLDLDRPATNWLIYQAALAGGDDPTAVAALFAGAQWITTALPQVPEAYRSSYCERNVVCRNTLAAAHALGWAPLASDVVEAGL